ncbi:MAG TPA: hypothetical protein VFX49_07200, partial [Chloroflexota bacterium]|nr:hypothetical protein [Chloroflexota bacterium]
MSNAVIAGPIAPSPRAAGAARRRVGPLLPDSRTILAASGCVMFGFIAAHLGGNLVAFAGSAAFNDYARSLRELGAPVAGEGMLLNLVRVVVGGALIAHLGAHARILLGGETDSRA